MSSRTYQGDIKSTKTVLDYDDTAFSKKLRQSQMDSQILTRQQQEMQLLISELKERDKELNNMVAAHHQQLIHWEKDRVAKEELLEELGRAHKEVVVKEKEVRSLKSKLRRLESENVSQRTAVKNSELHMTYLSDKHTEALGQIEELQENNRGLTDSVTELTNTLRQYENRERDLMNVLQSKDRDLNECAVRVADLTNRIKKLEQTIERLELNESDLKRNVNDYKIKYDDCWKDYDHYKREAQRANRLREEQQEQFHRLQQEGGTAKKELQLAAERERRKDQLLELQRSRSERSDQELSDLRVLYQQQQMDRNLLESKLAAAQKVIETYENTERPFKSDQPHASRSMTRRLPSPPRPAYRPTSPASLRYRTLSPESSNPSPSPYRNPSPYRTTSPLAWDRNRSPDHHYSPPRTSAGYRLASSPPRREYRHPSPQARGNNGAQNYPRYESSRVHYKTATALKTPHMDSSHYTGSKDFSESSIAQWVREGRWTSVKHNQVLSHDTNAMPCDKPKEENYVDRPEEVLQAEDQMSSGFVPTQTLGYDNSSPDQPGQNGHQVDTRDKVSVQSETPSHKSNQSSSAIHPPVQSGRKSDCSNHSETIIPASNQLQNVSQKSSQSGVAVHSANQSDHLSHTSTVKDENADEGSVKSIPSLHNDEDDELRDDDGMKDLELPNGDTELMQGVGWGILNEELD